MDKKAWINKFRKADRRDKFHFIVDRCKGKNVLDVGCVGQDKGYDSEAWLHGRIKKVAGDLTGADINAEGISELNERGYLVLSPEDLEKSGRKFDLIVMGDVIEHVNDPGQFLSFYAQFLNEGGEMIICTPNSFGARYFLQILIYGYPVINDEHTMAFDPFVMLELFKRIQLEPSEFYWLKEYRKSKKLQQYLIQFRAAIYIFLRRYYNSNFMFIVKKHAS